MKQKQHQQIYGINRIRAVLTETIDDDWAEGLRQAANHITVSGSKAVTTLLVYNVTVVCSGSTDHSWGAKECAYLQQPDIVFTKSGPHQLTTLFIPYWINQ